HERVRRAVGHVSNPQVGHGAARHHAVGAVGVAAGTAGVVGDVVAVVIRDRAAGGAIVHRYRNGPDDGGVGLAKDIILLQEGQQLVLPAPLPAVAGAGQV